MQALGAVTYEDLKCPAQELFYKLEVYDGATWRDLCNFHEALSNGDLELWDSATEPTGWIESEGGTSTVNRDAATVHGGTYSCRLDVDASNSLVAIQMTNIQLRLPLNYCVSGWYKTEAGKTAKFELENSGVDDVYLKEDGTWTTDVTYIDLPAATSWTRFAVHFTPHPAYTLYDFVVLRDAAASSSIWFDDLSIAAWPSNRLVDGTLTFELGGAGVSPNPVAATWSAEIANEDSIFHPRHPHSEFSELLRVGRQVRISVGGRYGGPGSIPSDGLVGYWPFDETSGTAAADHSSYGANGVLTNMDAADWVTGKVGNGLDFDGTDDYVEVADAAHLDITAAITVSAWVKPASIPAWASVIQKGTSSTWNNNNYVLGLQAGRIDFRWSAVGTCLVDVGDVLVAGTWAHICVTVEPGTTNAVKAYINGVLKKQTDRSGDPTPNAQALRIGTDNGTDDFPGVIDEVRIYSRALTALEVASLCATAQASTYWQRLIGYMDAPQFDNTKRTISISGGDYMKVLMDTAFRSPGNHWGSSVMFSTVATSSSLGAEIYAEADALEIGAGEANNITNWADDAACTASAAGSIDGSTYSMKIEKDTNNAGYVTNTNVGAVTAGVEYECSFTYMVALMEGGATLQALMYTGASLDGYSAAGGSETAVAMSFRFTASNTANMTLKFRVIGDAGTVAYVDNVSIKPVTTPGLNYIYTLPDESTGAYYATLDGVPVYRGDPAEKFGWINTEGSHLFTFVDGAIITAGTDNLIVYYYTEQAPENVIADLLAAGPGDGGGGAGLYANRAAALAAMTYTATGILIDKVWFEAESASLLTGVQKLCERCDYRFWFDELGAPHFVPAPTHNDPVYWLESAMFTDSGEFQDREEIRNDITLEGIERSFYGPTGELENGRFKYAVSDATSITAYRRRTYSATNDLFQDQDSLKAAGDAMLAFYKDPKWYSDIRVPKNPAPVQRGDSVEWDVELVPSSGTTAVLKNTLRGIVRDASFSGDGFNYKCEIRSKAMNIANYAAGPVTVTAEHCRGWMLTNAAAVGDVQFNLPAATVGMEITFYVLAAQTLTVNPNGTERISVLTGTAGDYLRSDAVIGSYIKLTCLVAGYWNKTDLSGTWTEEA